MCASLFIMINKTRKEAITIQTDKQTGSKRERKRDAYRGRCLKIGTTSNESRNIPFFLLQTHFEKKYIK